MNSVPVDYLGWKLQSGLTERLIILDTRPFMCYNETHVQGSINVHLPPIVKRRSGGFVALENIVRNEDEREALQNGKYTEVIAYDQNTEDLCTAAKDSNLYVIMQSLKQQVDDVNVVYMSGGFTAFATAYPSLTVSPSLCNNTKPPTLLNVNLPSANPRITDPVEILPHLLLGDEGHASDKEILQRSKVTAVLNVSTSCENHFESDFIYKHIPVQDNSNADLLSWFPDAIGFIESVRINGGRVLVHCRAGISRSATICLAYLMSKHQFSLDNAYDHIRQRRSIIDPNLNFMRQLKDYETQLCNSRIRRGSINGQECSPLTPSNMECGFSMNTFTFPVPNPCTTLVSPS